MSIITVQQIKRQENTKYVLSYGGGVNSTALMILLVRHKLPIDYVIFADTGSERPETYTYLKHA
ncbi:MAG: phosphoadenosine phosphosulfate reductase family protein, partial [Nitrososphaera sp.]